MVQVHIEYETKKNADGFICSEYPYQNHKFIKTIITPYNLCLQKSGNFAILISTTLILHNSYECNYLNPPNHTTVAFVHL